MSEEYLKEWGNLKVKAEELPKLQRKEKEAIDAFYLENYDYFIGCAKNLYIRNPAMMKQCDYEDVLQDIYANLFDVSFDSPRLFSHSLQKLLPYTAYGGWWNQKNIQHSVFCSLRKLPKVELNLDEPIADDTERTFKDLLTDKETPHTAWMKERERRRQDIIEKKSEELLRRILCPNYFKRWQAGAMHEDINRVLRKHADEILALLRSCGTPEYKLQGHIKTEAEYRAELSAKAAKIAWEREHIDELPEERREVLKHLEYKKTKNDERKAAERAERSARFAWEEAHLQELPIPERKRVQKRLSTRRLVAERRANV